MTMDYLKHTKMLLVSCLIILLMAVCFPCGQAAAYGDEAKVTSQGGYSHVRGKSQNSGSVKIIVQIRAPFTPESVLQEKDMHEQRNATARVQEQVISELENKGHKPGRVYKYKYTPYIAMTVDTDILDALLSSPDVIGVEEDMLVSSTLNWSVPRIGATELHESNVKGTGIVVAILDSGVDKTHLFLNGSVVSEACYSTNDQAQNSSSLCPGGVEESTAAGSAMPCGGTYSSDACGHGTHVAGIAAGRSGVNGSPGPGVAPESNIIAIQAFSRFGSSISAWNSDILKGLERVYELRNTYTIASVNMSLGGGQYNAYCDTSPLKGAIDNLRAAGIATVIASGNNGWCGSMGAPACISSAISVGATDSTSSDPVSYYSNSATFLSLLAPGSTISSSIPGGGYADKDGTSMAAPHVAGAWALMKQAYPAATVDEILDTLTSTGPSVTDTKQGCTSFTKKRINVNDAYARMSSSASLALSKTGVGTGTVTSVPSGIDCGEDCGGLFLKGIPVRLIATADPGTEFGGWSGGGCSGTGDCSITITATTSVNALFLKQVTVGSDIAITGFDFGDKKGKVLIGEVAAKIISWTDTLITGTVKKIPLPAGIYNASITSKAMGTKNIDNAFTVKNPELDPMAHISHWPGDEIIVTGNFFGIKKGKVYLEYKDSNGQTKKKNCKVTYWYMNPTNGASELRFVVPKLSNSFPAGTYPLKVDNKIGIATADTDFTILP
jgi:subtilisin family serine protease